MGRMIETPFIAHSELTNEIYIVAGKEKYCVTEQAIKAVMAIKALEQEPILDKIRAEIEEIHLIGYATVNGKREIASRAVMQIIDKYKAESEE